MIQVNNLKPGITFQEKGEIYSVLESSHSKQGRGQASVKVKAKNLRSGTTTIITFTGGSKVSKAHISRIDMDYLYNDGSEAHFMNSETFNQIAIQTKTIEWELKFLVEGSKIQIRKFEEEILDIEIPKNVSLKVDSAPDAVKGNTTTNPQKKVVLETGFEVETPMFIKDSDIVIISTETGKYIGKGK